MRQPPKGFRPKRRFGQNFLVNTGALETLVALFNPAPGDRVLEIGPGRGALTSRLVGRVAHLTAIEIDRDLLALLSETLRGGQDGALRLVEGDILSVDLASLLDQMEASPSRPARVIANLPYNIATGVILRLLEERHRLRDLLVMVQREVAARILARPGSGAYGGLSVMIQAMAEVETVLRLRPGSFRPMPRVESEAIRVVPRAAADALRGDEPAGLSRLLRQSFAHRRKTLLNNLRHLRREGGPPLGLEQAGELIRRAGLPPGARPEQVPVAGFLAMLRAWSTL